MTASKQKIYAFERAIELIEKSANNNHSKVSDKTFQALYKSYEKMTELFMTSDERRKNNFLALQIG
ncbi:MAG: hypothetical protein D3910_05435 [Candidatus Electrothrix sp. ATG2]|nr:hypothetical protein [Candidatus Electrothrix sp. ATG2]